MHSSDESIRVDFDEPPVVETVLSAQFERLESLRFVHFGLFWERVRSEFPQSQEQIALDPSFEQVDAKSSPGPRIQFIQSDTVPPCRLLLTNGANSETMQIQMNLTARGQYGEGVEFFDIGRRYIVNSFKSFTTHHMHKIWREKLMPALAEITHTQTPVFAMEQRQFLANLGTAAADVFSRSQRTVATPYAPETPRIQVTFYVGDTLLTLQYLDFGEGLPRWAGPVIKSLSERWGLAPGWDSYDAKPTELRYATILLNHLSSLLKSSTPPPVMTPLTDGGVQAEWHTESLDFEIVVPAEKPARFYCYDGVTQQEEEGFLESDRARVLRIIGNL